MMANSEGYSIADREHPDTIVSMAESKKKPEQGISGKEPFKLCKPYGEESVVGVSQGSAFLNRTDFRTHVSRHRG